MAEADISAYYGLDLEHERLGADGATPTLEYIRTRELLDRHLPPAPASVLDVGGGAGAYAFPLAELGYKVDLVDLIPLHVERVIERRAERVTARVGDARALDALDNSYDAVLLLGPLYHLTDEADRARALQQAVRVARPRGVVIAVGISRFASLLDGLAHGLLLDPTFRTIVERDLADGQHRNPDPIGRPEFFTTAYFHEPDELAREACDAGLDDVELWAIEGPNWGTGRDRDLDAGIFAARAVEREPSLIGASPHIMVTGRAP